MERKSVNGRYLLPDLTTTQGRTVALQLLKALAQDQGRFNIKATDERIGALTGCVLLMNRNGVEFDFTTIMDLAGGGLEEGELERRYGSTPGYAELTITLGEILSYNLKSITLDLRDEA